MIVTVPRLDRYCTGGGGDGGIVGGGFECIDVLTAGLKVNWSTGPRPLTIMVLGISKFPVQRPDHKIPFINSTVVVCLSGSCPQGWIGYSGSCYLPYVHGKTWQEANETCQEMDSHLALSKSVDENEFIAVEVGRPESRVWIGLRRSEGEFVWSDGSKSDFTNWGRFEPKDASVVGRDCVSLLPEDIFYSWEVRNCDDRQAFICERGKKTAIFNTKAIQTSDMTSGVFIHRYACAGKRHQR